MRIQSPQENRIASVSNAMANVSDLDIEEVKKDLREEGYSEYSVFLIIKAAEVNQVMHARDFPVLHDKRIH